MVSMERRGNRAAAVVIQPCRKKNRCIPHEPSIYLLISMQGNYTSPSTIRPVTDSILMETGGASSNRNTQEIPEGTALGVCLRKRELRKSLESATLNVIDTSGMGVEGRGPLRAQITHTRTHTHKGAFNVRKFSVLAAFLLLASIYDGAMSANETREVAFLV